MRRSSVAKAIAIVLTILVTNPIISINTQKIFILIHGTWSCDTDWHLPGGFFYDELEKSCSTCHALLIPYNWSGRLNHESRLQAARGLVKIIQSYPVDSNIYLIGHSHGGTVAILASQLLGIDLHNQHTLSAIYLLATPIDNDTYAPNMDIAQTVYNFFSRGDYIQQVFGLYTREFPAHERIANIRIIINDKELGHSNLHHPWIAKWLPHIPDTLAHKKINGFQNFCCANQGAIDFYAHKAPAYSLEFRGNFLAYDPEIQDYPTLLLDQEFH